MFIHSFTYMHRILAFIHTYICICMFVCVCICMDVCMYICICVCMHTCICMYVICMHNISGELSGGNVLPKMGGELSRGNCPGNCLTPHRLTGLLCMTK